MIEYIEGDLFNSPAQVLVNTVNTIGVMGKGIALSFKKRYPGMFEAYRTACEKHQLMIGKLMLYYAPDHWILLFPTKMNWRNPSKIEYLETSSKSKSIWQVCSQLDSCTIGSNILYGFSECTHNLACALCGGSQLYWFCFCFSFQ